MKSTIVMHKEYLQNLIEKYYQGETSLEEETLLFEHYNAVTSETSNKDGIEQFLYFKVKREEEPSNVFADQLEHIAIDPPATRTLHFRPIWRVAVALIIALGLGWYFFNKPANDLDKTWHTKAGEQLRVVLPDSTVVWLNGASELKCNKTFNQQQRIVWLQGEAYFEVRSDAKKTFIVHTGEVSTAVTGTAFNLRSYAGEEAIELDVTHGKVHFGSTKKIDVPYGHAVRFNLKRHSMETTLSNPNAITWKTHELRFEDSEVREVIHDLERYFHVSFEVDNPALLHCHFRADFREPSVEEVLSAMSYSLHIQYRLKNGRYILSGQNCNKK